MAIADYEKAAELEAEFVERLAKDGETGAFQWAKGRGVILSEDDVAVARIRVADRTGNPFAAALARRAHPSSAVYARTGPATIEIAAAKNRREE